MTPMRCPFLLAATLLALLALAGPHGAQAGEPALSAPSPPIPPAPQVKHGAAEPAANDPSDESEPTADSSAPPRPASGAVQSSGAPRSEAADRDPKAATPPKKRPVDRDAGFPDQAETRSPAATAAPPADPAGEGEPAATANPELFLGPQNVGVTIHKEAPAAVGLGQVMSYVIVIRNTGTQEVRDLVVRDQVPASAQFQDSQPHATPQGRSLTWKLGSLAAGQEQKIQVQILPQREGAVSTVATVQIGGGAASRTEVARPRIQVGISGAETAMVGDTVQLMLQATNPGPVPLSGVRLRAAFDPGLSYPKCREREIELTLGTLEPNKTKQAPLTLQVMTDGRLACRAIATADPDLRDRAEVTINAVQARLAVAIVGPRLSHLRGKAKYTVTVSNTGTGRTGSVHVTDALPPGFDVVDALPQAQLDTLNRTVIWDLPPIGPGEKQQLSLTLKSTQPGTLCNTVQAASDRNVHAEAARCCTSVEGLAALTMEVVDTEDPIAVGDHTTYELRVVNQGTTAATNIEVWAELPPGMEFLGAEGPSNYHVDKGTVRFDKLPQLSPKADPIYKITVGATAPGDDLRFKAHLKADQLKDPLTQEESTRVYRDE